MISYIFLLLISPKKAINTGQPACLLGQVVFYAGYLARGNGFSDPVWHNQWARCRAYFGTWPGNYAISGGRNGGLQGLPGQDGRAIGAYPFILIN